MNAPGEPLLPPLEGLRALMAGGGKGSADNSSDVQLFGYARQALAAGMRNLRVGSLLVPAYINDTAVDVLPPLGFPIRFYPVNDDLTPDWEWLDANRRPDDTALLLVHYFGFANDLNRAEEFCRYASISLVEDCAHSFLSQHQGQPLGSTGAFGIFSYRKILPLRTGAGYYSASGLQVPEPLPNRSNSNTFVLRQILKWAIFKSGSATVRRQFARAISDEGRVERVTSTAIDPFSKRLMSRLAPRVTQIRERRRQNYEGFLVALRGARGISFMRPGLGAGDCPWAFPIRVQRRDELLEKLQSEGIGAWAWPVLPDILPQQNFVNEVRMARESLLLPVHQDLRRNHIEFISDVVTAWGVQNG